MNIRNKIFLLLLSVVLLSISAIGLSSFALGTSVVEQEAFNKLTAVRELKADQIEDYFGFIQDQIVTYSEDLMIIEAMQSFDVAYQSLVSELEPTEEDYQHIDTRLDHYYETEFLERLRLNIPDENTIFDFVPERFKYIPSEDAVRVLQDLYISNNPFDVGLKNFLDDAGDGSTYSSEHARYHPIINEFLNRFDYYDIFLVDIESGHIVYSVFKEVDFGTSLMTGPYKDTNFAEAFRAARDAEDPEFVYLADFEPYDPSYNAPAGFIASPIFDGDQKIGILIFQFPIDRINDIMTSRQLWREVGLGESGETYIVGEDFMLRNQSRFLIEDSQNYFQLLEEVNYPAETINTIRNLNSTIGLQEVRTEGTLAALNGQSGTAIFPDYRGVPVLSAYRPLNIPGINWVIMSEIDEAEAFSFVGVLGLRTALTAIGVFALAALISLIFSKTLSSPLVKLTETAELLSYGSWDTVIGNQERKDEIGMLARNFQVMRDALKKLVDDLAQFNSNLENLVKERTLDLERSERRSASIVETAGEGVIVLDQNASIVQWNKSAERMLGYTREEILGRSISLIVPDQHHRQHEHAFRQANSAGGLVNPGLVHQLSAIRKDGSEFPIELTLSTWAIGNERFYSGILRDITERLQAEEDLRVSEERIRKLIEIAPDAIISIDSDQKITLFNSQAETVFGYPAAEVLEQPLTKLMPEQSRALHNAEVDKFGEETASARAMDNRRNIQGQRKNGEIFPAEAGISKVLVEGQYEFTVFFRDISERVAAQEALRASENKHRTIFQNSPLGVILFSKEGIILDCNEHFVTLMGSSREQLIGFNSLKNAADPEVRKGLAEAIAGNRSVFEGAYTSATGGNSLILRIIYNPIHPDETPTQVIATLEDITIRKEMEQQLAYANERMSQELTFARDIQMSMLPLIFPAFPNRNDVNIYAKLYPAREVGGDFYDFYFLDDDHLCFVIGDVSGKGAPGALLMAVSKTLIKSRAADDFLPSSILTHVNNEISANNDSAMFVTVFLGILNVQDGHFNYTNAGHNPPYIQRADGSLVRLDELHGPVIGAMPNLPYGQASQALAEGDTILLYTDGVTEALNIEDELYSENRLIRLLETENRRTPQRLIEDIVVDVKTYEGKAEQADDITVLAIQYLGQVREEETGRLEMQIRNDLKEMERVEEQFEVFCSEHEIPDAPRQQVSIVLDELLNNTISYAFKDNKEHLIDVSFVLYGKRLVIAIKDDGVPFNPFGIDPPDISLSVEAREVGGLGIFLVRSMMDEFSYQRQVGKNVITLIKIINE